MSQARVRMWFWTTVDVFKATEHARASRRFSEDLTVFCEAKYVDKDPLAAKRERLLKLETERAALALEIESAERTLDSVRVREDVLAQDESAWRDTVKAIFEDVRETRAYSNPVSFWTRSLHRAQAQRIGAERAARIILEVTGIQVARGSKVEA